MLGYTARQSDWADGAEIANQLPLTYGERPGSSRCTQRDRQGSEQKTEADRSEIRAGKGADPLLMASKMEEGSQNTKRRSGF